MEFKNRYLYHTKWLRSIQYILYVHIHIIHKPRLWFNSVQQFTVHSIFSFIHITYVKGSTQDERYMRHTRFETTQSF